MATVEQEYSAKRITVEDALSLVKSHDNIITTFNGLEPYEFLSRLHTIAERVDDVRLYHVGVFNPYRFVTSAQYKGKIIPHTSFTDPFSMQTHDDGVTEFVPLHFHNGFERDAVEDSFDVFVGMATPPDKHGYMRFSLGSICSPRIFKSAKTVIIEVNPNLPTVGGYTEIHISQVNHVYESDRPLFQLPQFQPNEVDKAVAAQVSSLVEDGSTIQLGIGKIPDATAQFFLDKNDLGVHSEMITSNIALLAQAGVINGSRKTLLPEKIVGTFALGDQKLYDFIDDNPAICLLPGEYVNNPSVIAKNYRMTSINTAIQVDLTGQIDSESFGATQYSGSGGAADFVIGADHAAGGKSIIAIPSTARHGTVSKIQPVLDPGSVVTVSRNDIDYVVTEYGVAKLKGESIAARVRNLINIAHPKFRDELESGAKQYKLW
jgi:acyl-CoA hydrolase